MTAGVHPDVETAELDPRRWWALGVLATSLGVVTIGNAAVNIALPVLARELDANTRDLQWVASAYGLALAGLLFTGGAIGDRFGRKGALLGGLGTFVLASLLAALGGSLELVVLARVLMGVAAALILPCSMGLLIDTFPRAERAKAIGIWTSALGIGGALGPFASGLVLAHLGYGMVFLLPVLPALFAIGAGVVLLQPSSDPEQSPVDLIGGLLSTVGIVTAVYAIVQGPREGWLSATTCLTLLAGCCVMGLFVLWELRAPHPMIDVRLFKNSAIVVGILGTIYFFLAMQGVMFLTAQHLQLVGGHSPLIAGLVNVPWGFLIFLGSMYTGKASGRWGGHRVVAASAVMVATSMVGIALLVGPSMHLWLFVLLMGLFHIGFGLGTAPLTVAIMSNVPARRAGGGGALNSFAREVGGALGVAVVGSIAASIYTSRLTQAAQASPSGVRESVLSSLGESVKALEGSTAEWADSLLAASKAAFDDGFVVALTVLAVLALVFSVAAYRKLAPR